MPIFPAATLATERLLLRPFEAADVDPVAQACSDDEVQRWLPLPRPYGREEAADWCLRKAPELRESGAGLELAIVTRSAGQLAGCIGLKQPDWVGRVVEVGYWSAPATRRRGYLSEAVRSLTDWVLTEQGFERVELLAATGNVASQRVAERAGFTREGVLRNAGFTHDGRVDLVMYAKIRADLPVRVSG
ncbi:MAG: GNAT family N-acetyltransferase [Actinomycetota bacterium]|nr:GNAT family N-acetyltransferase [Actinomycetota bacterium]